MNYINKRRLSTKRFQGLMKMICHSKIGSVFIASDAGRVRRCLLSAIFFLFTSEFAVLECEASIIYSSLGSTYSQNFDTLASSGSPTWTDNGTLAGWYAIRENPPVVPPGTQAPSTYTVGTGSSAAGGLYSFGVAGTNPVTDRALGSIASGGFTGTSTVWYGVALQNTTGSTINQVSVGYTGEQWRDAADGSVANALGFSYLVTSSLGILNAAGGTSVSALDFTNPVDNAGASALDGNAPANRILRSASITGVNWLNNQFLWLRWQDIDNTGADHGLAIDDLVFSTPSPPSPPAAVPEPSSFFMLMLAGVGAGYRKVRKNKILRQ